jgi:hypothetical protein
MGYRSDVEILFYPENPEEFAMLKLYVEENLPDKFEEGGMTCRRWPQGNKYLHLRREAVKWHPTFEDVAVYDECFSNWEAVFGSPPRFHYEFVRLGEEDNDIEEQASENAHYALLIQRGVDINFGL